MCWRSWNWLAVSLDANMDTLLLVWNGDFVDVPLVMVVDWACSEIADAIVCQFAVLDGPARSP